MNYLIEYFLQYQKRFNKASMLQSSRSETRKMNEMLISMRVSGKYITKFPVIKYELNIE